THADRRQRLGACVFQRRQQRLQRGDGGQQGGVVGVLEGRAVDRQGRDADGAVRCGEDGLFADEGLVLIGDQNADAQFIQRQAVQGGDDGRAGAHGRLVQPKRARGRERGGQGVQGQAHASSTWPD